MIRNKLIVGIRVPPGEDAAVPNLRDLTIAWLRYGYRGRILQSDRWESLLEAASQADHRYCLVLESGCLIDEHWSVAEEGDFFVRLEAWIDSHRFHICGVDGGGGLAQAPTWLLVDLHEHARRGRPSLEFLETPRSAPSPVLQRGILDLRPSRLGARGAAAFRGSAIVDYQPGAPPADLSPPQRRFLAAIKTQTANARRGVFLWNIESYDDVEAPPAGLAGPLSTLYSVAAGFKPNRILQTHGFDRATRVVYFDYSRRALQVRRALVERWDGEDFPRFARRLMTEFPAPETYYQLWDDLTPEQITDDDLKAMWQRELERWGGPASFRTHWLAYRRLSHRYVDCDLLSSAAPLVDAIEPEATAVIWWSNAFFTMYGNWLFPLSDRKAVFNRWIEQLAARNPDLYLLGSDYNNANVNGVRAGPFREVFQRVGQDELSPCRLAATELRM